MHEWFAMNLPQVENQTIKTNNKVFENKDKKLKTIKEEESHVILSLQLKLIPI